MKKTLKKCFLLILPLAFLALTTTNFMSHNAYADIQKSDKCFQLSIKRTIKNSDEEPTIAKTGEICAINLTPDGKIKKPGMTDGQYDPGTTFTTKNPESNISGFGITFKAITPSSGPGLASRIEVDCDPAYNSTGGCGSITISDGMSWSDVESNMRSQVDAALNLKNQANLTFQIVDEEGSGTGQTGSKYGDRQTELRKLAASCKQQYQDQVNKSPDDELTNDVGSPFNGRVNVEHKAGNATDNFIDAWLVETTNENGEGTGEYDCYPLEGFEKPDLSEIRANLNTSDEEEDEEEKDCFNSGGAQSLGWIVCPLMTWMGDAAEEIYNNFVKPSLNIQPSLFTGTDTGARVAWNAFRDIANVCFIIIVLVVIFSQVTGVGIDNYGIKKILPKLIIVAILVNLSYVLCEACVDLSNILGNALQSMLEGFPSGSPPPDNPYGIDNFAFDTFETVAIIGAFFAGGLAIWKNPAIVLSLFIGLLGVIISILFLFLLLAARQAAIVVLIVLSPLAAICYALPNTKTFSDKWVKFFKGLLLVYPIAGLLVGGGDFVSELLLSSGFGDGGFFTAFMAMVVGIVPIFFIPTVLKGSFAAMGNIGAKISGMGSQLSRATTSKARNMDMYKNAQQRGLQRRNRIEAGLDRNYRPVNGRRQRFANSAIGRAIGYNQSFSQKRRAALNERKANRPDNSLADEGNYNRSLAQQNAEFQREDVAAIQSDIASGNVIQTDADGNTVLDNNGNPAVLNVNNQRQLSDWHRDQLAAADRFERQTHDQNLSRGERQQAQANYEEAMNNVRAAQNILLTQGEGGRTEVRRNIQRAVTVGQTGGVREAAAQALSENGDLLHSTNRGAEREYRELANGTNFAQTIANRQNGVYAADGLNGMNAEQFVSLEDDAMRQIDAQFDHLDPETQNHVMDLCQTAVSNQRTASKIGGSREYIDRILARRNNNGGGGGGGGGHQPGGGQPGGGHQPGGGGGQPHPQLSN